MSGRSEPAGWAGFAHLAIVYVVWGSTYLAIRVAVREEGGFPPFMLGATRTAAAAALLLAWALLRRARMRPTRSELAILAFSGALMWVGGNGLVNWAERRADSGYAALLVGTLPLWVVLIESLVDRRRPTLRLVGALVVGFSGLAVLTWPVLRDAEGIGAGPVLALIAAPLAWGTGSILQTRRPVRLPSWVSAGYQQLAGAAGFLVFAWILGEPAIQPSGAAVAAWVYLVVAGSLIAFTSFLRALQLLPTSIVMTYAYVNPVIALLLGWLLLDEPITAWTIAGAALVLSGVAGVFRAKAKAPRVRAGEGVVDRSPPARDGVRQG